MTNARLKRCREWLIEQHLTEHVIKDTQAVDEAELQEFLKLLKRYS